MTTASREELLDLAAAYQDAADAGEGGSTIVKDEYATIARALRLLAEAKGPAKPAPTGWRIVPAEPTPEMLANTVDANGLPRVLDFTTPGERGEAFLMPRYTYRAMLDAAPSPPPAPGYAEGRLADERDAARYRWLRADNAYVPEEQLVPGGAELDDLCDDGIAAAAIRALEEGE